MSSPDSEIVHVSDTALMVAACRALETARPSGIIRDPFAERLAGSRGLAIARAFSGLELMCFGIAARTFFLDELVTTTIAGHSIATVLSIGSGLDARPWRLDLPPELRWIEVDFPDMLDYKSALLEAERPHCRLERLAADVTDPAQRNAVFAAAGDAPALMITEGLLMYLPAGAVEALAVDSPRASGVRYWMMDTTSQAFAKRVHMASYQSIENVRAARPSGGRRDRRARAAKRMDHAGPLQLCDRCPHPYSTCPVAGVDVPYAPHEGAAGADDRRPERCLPVRPLKVYDKELICDPTFA